MVLKFLRFQLALGFEFKGECFQVRPVFDGASGVIVWACL